jgi:hypothetical protein
MNPKSEAVSLFPSRLRDEGGDVLGFGLVEGYRSVEGKR